MIVTVSPKKVLFVLGSVSAALLAVHIAGQTARLGFGHAQFHGLIPLFDVEDEGNVPSYWSSMLWLAAAGAAFLNAHAACARSRRDGLHWCGLSLLFAAFSMDETVQFHERLGGLVAAAAKYEGLKPSGMFYYVWVVPAGLFALVVFGVYLRFLVTLPRGVSALMVLAGAVFLAGALGFEVLEAPIDEAGGYKNALYTAYVTCEEGLEMAGVCVLVYALLRHAALASPRIELTIGENTQREFAPE